MLPTHCGHILQGSPDSMQLEPSRRSCATCRRSCISSRLLPLSSSHLCLCNSLPGRGAFYFHSRHLRVEILEKSTSPLLRQNREGGTGTENMLHVANKGPPADSAPSMFVYTWLMPRGRRMPCLHRSGTDIPLRFTLR